MHSQVTASYEPEKRRVGGTGQPQLAQPIKTTFKYRTASFPP